MTIERRPRQFLAVWSDDGKSVKGSTFEESLYVDDQFWKNEITNVPPEGWFDFGKLFSSELQVQHDELAKDKEKLTTDLASMTTERDTVTKTLADTQDRATANLVEVNLKHDEQVKQLQDENKALLADNTACKERLGRLIVELPFDTRIIDASAFLQRITTDETFKLFSSDDPNMQGIAGLLKEYKEQSYPIHLDDPQVAGAMQYLTAVGLLSEDRVKEITRDATWAEAYSPPTA